MRACQDTGHAEPRAGLGLLVVPAPNRWVTPNFKDCRTVASIDNGYGLDNELWEHVVKLCSGPVRPWSQLWPSLRHY